MSREELIRQTYYSFFYETMLSTFYGRVDRILNFVLLLLGSAVFASFGDPIFIGAVIAVVSSVLFVWQPAKSALLCDIQAKKMKSLIYAHVKMDDDLFHQQYREVQETDSPNIGALRDPAMKRAYIATAHDDESRKIKLSAYQRLLSHLAGDCPKDV
jgi:hypothetical protein